MSEVTRKIIYRQVNGEYEPVLSISPKVPRAGHKADFAIRMEDLWMYTPDKNPTFDKWMYQVCAYIHKQFNLGVVTAQRMAQIASTIEDGIDDLLKAPPDPPAGTTMKEAMEKAMRERDQDSRDVAIKIGQMLNG